MRAETETQAKPPKTGPTGPKWKMMEHDAKIQVPRWEKLGFNTHHPNPCMGFHCQTCEHFGNGGA